METIQIEKMSDDEYFALKAISASQIKQYDKGRILAMNWLVAPVNKWLGFKERSTQYCFVGLMIR